MCRLTRENSITRGKCGSSSDNTNNKFELESYNVRGMRTYKKRCDFTKWLKTRKNVDLTILVDTHCHLPREARQWNKF